jgi:hypothetical protein
MDEFRLTAEAARTLLGRTNLCCPRSCQEGVPFTSDVRSGERAADLGS